jgi:hypothetical protein
MIDKKVMMKKKLIERKRKNKGIVFIDHGHPQSLLMLRWFKIDIEENFS